MLVKYDFIICAGCRNFCVYFVLLSLTLILVHLKRTFCEFVDGLFRILQHYCNVVNGIFFSPLGGILLTTVFLKALVI